MPPHAGVALPTRWAGAVSGGGALPAPWWSAFGDALLVRLVEAALEANTDVGAARARLLQARAARELAAAALSPALSSSLSARRSGPAGGAGAGSFEAGLSARWDADLSGANRHGLAAQEALADAADATLAATRLAIAAEVAQSYLALRGAQARIAVARENLASQEETLQISAWRRQAGLASELEVEQARAAVEQTRAQVPALQSSAAQLAHALGVLAGGPPEAWLEALAPAQPLPQPPADVAVEVPVRVIAQRPDVAAAAHRLRSAAEAVGQADAARLPALDVSASLAFSGATLASLGSASAARALLASLVQPVFDAGAARAQVAGRRGAYQEAAEAYRASALAALQEVEDALAALANERQRLAALQRALAAARAAADIATQRHAGGLVDFQTVLETQRTLLSVQDAVALARTQLATDQVLLYKAVGGGWAPPGAGSPP